ncbi:FAD-binding domain-containing protein [Gloeopeniophorella convolvens]|nr:FAD-binding domain-containing protein [Gloeopeniophorella convolvens]
MINLFSSVAVAALAVSTASGSPDPGTKLGCRNQPGDPGWPTNNMWAALNATIGGRLLAVVPSARACRELNCTEDQWTSGIYRQGIPGSMNVYNWEEDYNPPAQLCLHNGTTQCAQGMVPLYAVNATSAQHIQAGVQFALANNLRVSIKASGHDYKGCSTAKNSLLLWTAYLKNVTFTDNFVVGGQNLGPAVTVGSGVGLKTIYAAAKAQGRAFVGGTAATVSPAGGYAQGAGHSMFSPNFGLAADNVLQFTIVLADGTIAIVNSVSYSDLFYALRGGGAGSWGVIIDATFHTYPIFNATMHSVNISTSSPEQTGDLMTAHARHVRDWDQVKAGQFFWVYGSTTSSTLALVTFFKDLDGPSSKAQLAAFLADATALGATLTAESTITAVANDIIGLPDDASGYNTVLGSRLIPNSVYLNAPESIGAAYTTLLKDGCPLILGHLVAGGQVSANADIDSAVHPGWRTAKTHEVQAIRQAITTKYVPTLANIAGGASSASYSNEGDVQEPDFQTTFYGPDYARLEQIKSIYDPTDLFIVRTGVHSEHWDSYGLCRIS